MLIDISADHWWARSEACKQWCREHGIDPNDTYHLVIDTDGMVVQVFQFDRNEQGALYKVMSPTGWRAVTRKPFEVAIKSVPAGFETS